MDVRVVHFMARSLQIVIEESAEFLEKQLKQTRTASQKERLQILWWLKTGQVQQHQELACLKKHCPRTVDVSKAFWQRQALTIFVSK
jgi:hypothetical protein